eukprot:CAMPEP_0118689916 /NCGR_PEP_ID=MMETSP0800-20121206/9770_1 /TAXON_ID=210618 ORGANISM="Striatella unipunctata, Strain CCMP2910" /NCGR_SAMPLE_ID=MMETSP0800 /ASSEMBLY_ACC=CAM_ASM_000638 /LENGTH=179 /DNA_ID=CAMNT_0006587397 /DNA_START=234 /DNA_END=770 /DNA_ORIENTATION=+
MSLFCFLIVAINLVWVQTYVNPKPITCPLGKSTAVATACWAGKEDFGLLHGIDVASSEYFTSSLKMDAPDNVDWLMERGLFWNAATMDAKERNVTTIQYIEDVVNSMIRFKKRDEVHDREKFYSFLEQVFQEDGKLLLVLGGKSVGKSLVLADFERKLEKRKGFCTLLVNARRFSGASL